jgi:predicted phage terminase large subunit-like protein
MSTLERELIRLKTRNDLSTFIHRTFQTVAPAQPYLHNWHIDAMAWHLEQCAIGAIKRLVITLPPRYGKSICASVAFPAWVLGRDPSNKIICASYSENLASKHAGDCRTVMESDWYRSAFPSTRISRDKNMELNYVTTRKGFRYSTSVGGTLTGRGGNLIIVDDPINPEGAMSEVKRSAANNWFDNTLYSRMDSQRNDVIILVMQRLHVEDLAGHVVLHEHWTHLDLPAIAESEQRIQIGNGQFHERQVGDLLHEERDPRDVLEKLKRTLGSFNFSAQYQQCPVPPEGDILKWSWFQFFDALPARVPNDRIIQSWDTASKSKELNDYSVCTSWLAHGNRYYLFDVLREKLDYPDLKRRVMDHAARHNANSVLIEDKGSGISLIQDICRENNSGMPNPIGVVPEGDKITRMSAQSAKIEARQVYLPKQAPWLGDLQAELLQFPHGRHDDQVDSISQFLNWIQGRPGSRWSIQPFPF